MSDKDMWEQAKKPDALMFRVKRHLRSKPIVVTDRDGARQYATIAQWANPQLEGECVHVDSPIAVIAQATAMGVALAVLDRLRSELGWTEEQHHDAFDALTKSGV